MDFYSEHLIRDGFGADVAKASEAWKAGASNAAPAAVSQALLSALSYASGIEGEIDRLRAQDEARVELSLRRNRRGRSQGIRKNGR